MRCDVRTTRVLAPNFKRRLSGVTATVMRLVPLQAKHIAIAAAGPVVPDHVPQIRLRDMVLMDRGTLRVWHARRNVEMIAGLALRDLLGKRLALLFTSASQRSHTRLTKWLIARMDRIVATSHKTASYLERDATVIHHGIDTGTFCPASDKIALRQQLNLPEDRILIGCYGRIRAQKGTDVFVDAMIKTCADNPRVTALVIGRATAAHEVFERNLKTRIADAGLSDRILFLPEVPVWEMARWYQVLDLYVAPQRWEGFGLTPLEAMACGVPVVATTVGAFNELIDDGTTGLLIAPGDITAMTGAVARLLGDGLRTASTAARSHAVSNFGLDREAAALIEVYSGLLGDAETVRAM